MPSTDFENLTEHDCLALLGSVSIGRLLFTENALPAVRTVRFTTADHRIVLRATEGSWADRLDGTLVAFTADQINPDTQTGWTVLVHGTARRTTHPHPELSVIIERITGQHLTLT